MTASLLTSKFFIPRTQSELVPRQHLIERLNMGLERKLTLISAPAGFGKTTLVSEWVRHCGRPVAWLSLDKNDNNLTRFLTYFIAALQNINGDIGTGIQAALSASQSPQSEMLLTKLVNEIEDNLDESIMVLDDYHLIDSKEVRDALNFLIDYLPKGMHLVISGRSDPALPISQLRVRGAITEIRTPDLRFSQAEMTIFLNDLMGFDLSSEDIAALGDRTEGWVASLQLAALSMHGRDDWHEFITAFSGSNRYVIDYLVDEVMLRQPENVRTFLRRTSILERFCAPLCEAVVNEEGIGDMDLIDYLDRSNLFVIPLDGRREWYRFHHLFGDFLKQRLVDVESEYIFELHRRACQWYITKGMVDEAIHHALAAKDFEKAIGLVDEIAADLIVQREFSRLLELIDQLSNFQFHDYPMLCVWYAWALLFLGRLEEVEKVLEISEANKHKVPELPLSSYVLVIRSYLANQTGELIDAIALAEKAIDEMSVGLSDKITIIHQGAAIIWLGVNHRYLADLHRASKYFQEAIELNQKAGNIYGALAAFEQSADLAMTLGQLHKSENIYRQGLEVAKSWSDEQGIGQDNMLAASGLHKGLGTVLYQKQDLVAATPHIQLAAKLDEVGGGASELLFSYTLLAYLKQAGGDYDTAFNLMAKANKIRDRVQSQQYNISSEPSLEQLRILLSRAHPKMAHLISDVENRIDALGKRPNDDIDFSTPVGYSYEPLYSDLARALVALNQAAEALPLLDRLLEAANSMGRQGDEIRYLILIALAHQSLGDMTSSLDSLSNALNLAEPEGYVRIFVDEGIPMARLLLLAISQDIAPDYIEELIVVFPDNVRDDLGSEGGPMNITQPLVEPLSKRELDVLRLIVAGNKYKEVAEQLVISLNTVRHHTRNVYRKLNVNSRTQAIAKAKELNLQ